jgi:hypothetical protein
MRKQVKSAIATISLWALVALPASAEWEWTQEYLQPRFESLIKSSIEKGKSEVAKRPRTGVPIDQLCPPMDILNIQGRQTWDEGSPGYGKAYYVWSPGAMTVMCWEVIKKGLPRTPFDLAEGVTISRIEKIVYFPFSDPGPSVFFYFAKSKGK